MADESKTALAARLLHDLQHNEELRQKPVAGVELDPQLVALRTWQSRRLAHTYTDLLDDPQAGAAMRFFLSDIYAPRDFSQRDHDIERVYAFLSHLLPTQTLQVLSDSIALNHLSNELDIALCQALAAQGAGAITGERYVAGYRTCANYDARDYQIDLLAKVLRKVAVGSRMRVVSFAMLVAGGPARSAGWIELYDFLERGYSAFRQLRDAEAFISNIEQHERTILKQIFFEATNPFRDFE